MTFASQEEESLAVFELRFGQPSDSVPVPAERFEQFSFLPSIIHTAWRRYGFSSFHDGLVWICDPLDWTGPVDAWTSGLQLNMGTDRWWCLSRNAYGDLKLWGERTGPSLEVNPHNGWVVPSDYSDEVAQNGGEFIARVQYRTNPKRVDLVIDSGKQLFNPILKKLGPVGRDEMYSFVPSPRFGGPEPSVKTAVIEKAIPQLEILAQAAPIGVLGDIGTAWLDSGIEI